MATKPLPSVERGKSGLDELADDVIDRVFRLVVEDPAFAPLLALLDEKKQIVRKNEGGLIHYVRKREAVTYAVQVLRYFNGRNPKETARLVGCSLATVYRIIRQAGKAT